MKLKIRITLDVARQFSLLEMMGTIPFPCLFSNSPGIAHSWPFGFYSPLTVIEDSSLALLSKEQHLSSGGKKSCTSNYFHSC